MCNVEELAPSQKLSDTFDLDLLNSLYALCVVHKVKWKLFAHLYLSKHFKQFKEGIILNLQ